MHYIWKNFNITEVRTMGQRKCATIQLMKTDNLGLHAKNCHIYWNVIVFLDKTILYNSDKKQK